MKVSVKYFMILLFFCMVEYTYGQNVNVSHLLLEKDTIGNITKTIVRGYDKSAVLYIEQNGKHYFTSMSYSEPDTGHNFNLVNLKKLEIDPSYNVNDFKIVGTDYVYFCGEHVSNNSSYGFIGFFDLQELLQGNTVPQACKSWRHTACGRTRSTRRAERLSIPCSGNGRLPRNTCCG